MGYGLDSRLRRTAELSQRPSHGWRSNHDAFEENERKGRFGKCRFVLFVWSRVSRRKELRQDSNRKHWEQTAFSLSSSAFETVGCASQFGRQRGQQRPSTRYSLRHPQDSAASSASADERSRFLVQRSRRWISEEVGKFFFPKWIFYKLHPNPVFKYPAIEYFPDIKYRADVPFLFLFFLLLFYPCINITFDN